jgi:L-alanine-DL-glutamate epimerase-like enolase superfamily enzyme
LLLKAVEDETPVKTFPDDGAFRDLIFVKVGTDAGLYGWGVAGCMGRERACEATVHEIEHAGGLDLNR